MKHTITVKDIKRIDTVGGNYGQGYVEVVCHNGKVYRMKTIELLKALSPSIAFSAQLARKHEHLTICKCNLCMGEPY